jgi:tetratricopeptide (TPR) repeat protein
MQALFDDHFEALPAWREAGLSGLTCVHVDAHLDVSQEGFSPAVLAGLARARTRAEVDSFRGNPKLPWGGLHCGNYLYPALLDGTVTTLIWVVPRDFLDGTAAVPSARQNLQGWIDLTFGEYRSLRKVDGYVEGVLFDRRLIICSSESMPRLRPEEKVALDIDVDYFIRLGDDRMWQTPHQLRQDLGDLKPVALTVATSCEGGYTPAHYRFLGRVCLDVFGADSPDAWREEVAAFAAAEQQGEEALQAFLEQAPDFMRPALLSRLGRHQEAAALDRDYSLSHLDRAGRYFSKEMFAEGLSCLESLGSEHADSRYLRAFLAMGTSQLELTLEQVDALLTRPGVSDQDRARLLALQAEIAGKQGKHKKAIGLLQESLKLEPGRASCHHFLANQLRVLGDREEASKHLRKALRLSRGHVSSLQIMLDASRLYDELGQKALAQATRRELEDQDVTGIYAINSILDAAAQ